MPTSRFSFRALTSLVLFWMFVFLLISGVVLFVAPPGRFAHWADWRLLALTKEQWQAVHTMTALAFVTGGLFHLFKFNRHVIWTYVKRSRQAVAPFRGVVTASILVSTLVVVGAAAGWPPFSLVVKLGETATHGWESAATRAPSPHAEELPLHTIVSSLDLDLEAARAALGEAGIEINGFEQTMRAVADANQRTPLEIYTILRRVAPEPTNDHRPGTGSSTGFGFGRKTVSEAAAELGIGSEVALQRLQGAGLDAAPGDRLRTIADRAGTSPTAVHELLSHENGDQAMASSPRGQEADRRSPRGRGKNRGAGRP